MTPRRHLTSSPAVASSSRPHPVGGALRSSTLVVAGVALALLPATVAGAATVTPPPAATTAKASICTLAGENRTTVAAIKGKQIQVYGTDLTKPVRTLTNWVDVKGRVVFNVIGQQGDFLDVKVPAKPNGAHGFVKASDVDTFQHSCRIIIELSKRTLTAYKGDEVFLQETVAIGTSINPTPLGTFFTTSLIRPIQRLGKKKVPDPGFGPYAYTLSGFSETLENFGGGNGTLGIHGTNKPQLLGQAISHGCIRMSNAGITKLALAFPLGVPVEIKP